MKLEIIVLDKSAQRFKQPVVKYARRLVPRLLRIKGAGLMRFLPKKGSAEIYLISSARMRGLNKRFRGKDKTTTVLSFEKPKDFPGRELGEVYINPIFVQKKKQDLSRMLVHGVLHILGFNHKKKHDRIKMQKKENELLSKLLN